MFWVEAIRGKVEIFWDVDLGLPGHCKSIYERSKSEQDYLLSLCIGICFTVTKVLVDFPLFIVQPE